MKHFELRFLDGLDRVVVTRAWTGQDILAALAEAERLSDCHTIVEVWHRARRLASIKNRDLVLATQEEIRRRPVPTLPQSKLVKFHGTSPGSGVGR